MFNNQRYITRGIDAEIPFELQVFMWECKLILSIILDTILKKLKAEPE